jgi:hypothetical protein
VPPAIVDRHLARMLAGPLAVVVSFGSTTTRGLFDEVDVVVQDGEGAEREVDERSVVLARADADLLAQYQAITIDGGSYQVRRRLKMEDGRLVRVVVAKVVP